MRLTHWKCARCKKLKKLRTEIMRADAGALCIQCQQEISGNHAAEGSTPAQEQQVYVRRVVKTPRNHDRDHE